MGLRKYSAFDNRIFSHDTIANVISRLSPKGFQACFGSWTPGGGGSHRRRGYRGGRPVRARLPGSVAGSSCPAPGDAWAGGNRRVLGQEATAEISNEITAIPKLLELLEPKGCLITIDARGCQQAIATQIRAQGGDDVLGLQGNQSALPTSVEGFFAVAMAGDFAGVAHDDHEEINQDHGRVLSREIIYLSSSYPLFRAREVLEDLAAGGTCRCRRQPSAERSTALHVNLRQNARTPRPSVQSDAADGAVGTPLRLDHAPGAPVAPPRRPLPPPAARAHDPLARPGGGGPAPTAWR